MVCIEVSTCLLTSRETPGCTTTREAMKGDEHERCGFVVLHVRLYFVKLEHETSLLQVRCIR
jgi:hypothetical protein